MSIGESRKDKAGVQLMKMPRPLLLCAGLVWFTATLIVLAVNLFPPWTLVLGSAVGAVAYSTAAFVYRFGSKERRSSAPSLSSAIAATFAQCVVVACISLAATTVTVVTCRWVTWDPVGSSLDGGIGDPFSGVTRDTSVSNLTADLRVTIREETGFLDIADGGVIYVFIGRHSETPDKSTLVFRYFCTEKGLSNEPEVGSRADGSILITVGDGDIQQITKQRDDIDGLRVVYRLGPSAEPPALHFWQRPIL